MVALSRAGGYTLRPMPHSTHNTSKLRRMRLRVGCSAAELARIAGVAPGTVLNAERGKVNDPQTRRHIEGALGVVLQRDTYARIGEARAAVTRAEVELEATRARLDATQVQHEHDVEQLAVDLATLWDDEGDDEAADAAEAESLAA